MFIDPNQLKPIIAAEVMKKTGYQLYIEGDLTWSFYPRLGVKMKHVTLSEPNQTQPFLNLNEVRIATSPWELWHGVKSLKGNVYAANVTLGNMNAEQVSVDLHWQNDILTLQPINASLYQGSLQGLAHVQVVSDVPRLDWDVQFHQIQLQSLLHDVNANSKLNISGVGYVKITASTQGKTREELLNHLNGTSDFKLSNGVIEGVNINYWIQAADALLHKQPEPVAPVNLDQTAFDDLGGSVTLTEGLAKTNNLMLTAPAFVATAEGTVALNAKTIDLSLQVKPHTSITTPTVSWAVPVLIQGELQHPDVRLNMEDIRKLLFKQEIDKVKAKAREIIKEHIPGSAGSFLQNLLSSR
jgi:uncharacterized protein involved in outer membrane biogenesis